jgi:hypothetical protein
MSPRDATGKCAVRNCGEAHNEWNYNKNKSENFVHLSK